MINTGSKTLLSAFLVGEGFGVDLVPTTSNRSGALRFRDGRVLRDGNVGATLPDTGFLAADLIFGRGFSERLGGFAGVGFARDLAAGLLRGGVVASDACMPSFCTKVRFEPWVELLGESKLEVVEIAETAAGSEPDCCAGLGESCC